MKNRSLRKNCLVQVFSDPVGTGGLKNNGASDLSMISSTIRGNCEKKIVYPNVVATSEISIFISSYGMSVPLAMMTKVFNKFGVGVLCGLWFAFSIGGFGGKAI